MITENAGRTQRPRAVNQPLAVEALVRGRPEPAAVPDADAADGLGGRVRDSPRATDDARRLRRHRQRRRQARFHGARLTQSDRSAEVHHVGRVTPTTDKLQRE